MKSNFCQQPFKLIDIDENGKYMVVQQTLTLFENISQPFAVISIAGLYRTGKSYLLNRVILNRADGFETGSTINSCTKGLWIWGKPLIGKSVSGELINILVIDSEGFGSTEEEINYDTKLFALNMMLTSCLLYNTMGAIDQNSMSNLALIANIVKGFNKNIYVQNDSPQLLWILRDFCLQLVSTEGNSITSNQYLQKALELTQQEGKNQVRQLLTNVFVDRDCITLVRPLNQQQNFSQLHKLQLQDLKPQFIQQAISMRKRLLNQIKPKKYFGRQVDGILFCKMLRNYIDIINNGTIPQIQSIWKCVSDQSIMQATMYFQDELQMIIKQKITSKLPIYDQQLNKVLQTIQSMLLEQLKTRISCYQGNQQCIINCRKLVTKKFLDIHISNQSKMRQQIQKNLSSQFISLEKKIISTQIKTIEELMKQFQKCNQLFIKKMSIKGSKVSQLVNNISLNKIIETSKSLVHVKDKQIQHMKYKLKQIDIRHDDEIRQLKSEIQSFRSSSILEMNRLESDRKEIELRQLNLKEMIQQLKSEKSRLEQSMETQSRRQKSMSVRTVSEMKFKLDQYTDKNQQNQRKVILIKSQHQKVEALLRQKIEFQDRMITQLKQQVQKYSQRSKTLKQSSTLQIKQLTSKIQQLNKSKLLQSSTMLQKISDLQLDLLKTKDQISQQKQKSQRIVVQYQFKQDQLLRTIQQLELSLKQKSSSKNNNEQLLQNAQGYVEKIQLLEKSIGEKEEIVLQYKNELKLREALLGQKVEFYEMEIGELNRKYDDEVSKNTGLMAIMGVKQEQLQKQLKQKYESDLKQIQNQFEFEISHLKKQLQDVLFKKCQMQMQYSNTKSNLGEQVKELQDKNKNLEQTKNRLMESLRQVQSQKTKQLKHIEQRNSQTINELTNEIDKLKTENSQQIKQLQQKNLDMVKHLKNYYEMQKEKYQKKILEFQEKNKMTPIQQLQQRILLLEAQNDAYQKQLESSRQQLQSIETTHSQRIKQYQTKVAELMSESNLLKQQKHAYFQQSSKQRLKRQQQANQQIQALQSSLLNCQGKLDNCYNDFVKKQKQLSVSNLKKQQLQTQLFKKQQMIQDLKAQMQDDESNYHRQLKQMSEKYYKISEQSLKYKLEVDKQMALAKQQNEFNAKKLQELLSDKHIYEQKLIQLKLEHQSQLQHINSKYNTEIQSKIQSIDKIRKSHKQQQSKLSKLIGTLQKQKIQMQQQLKLLELKHESLNKQYQRHKQQQSEQTTNYNEFQNEISILKISVRQFKSKYEIEKSKLSQTQSNYERDKLLWDNKAKFLQTQRDQAKLDLSNGLKKFETALTQINKSRTNDDSLQDVTKSIERKYTLQIQNIKQTYQKKQLESDSTIKLLNMQIKKLKNQLAKQKQIYQSKISQQIQLVTLANNTISQQMSKQLLQKQYQIQSLKKQFSQKLTHLQKSLKQSNIKVDHLKVILQKQQVKSNIQKKSLSDNVQQLMANNEQLFRENQRFKNKEKLLGKKFIKQF